MENKIGKHEKRKDQQRWRIRSESMKKEKLNQHGKGAILLGIITIFADFVEMG